MLNENELKRLNSLIETFENIDLIMSEAEQRRLKLDKVELNPQHREHEMSLGIFKEKIYTEIIRIVEKEVGK